MRFAIRPILVAKQLQFSRHNKQNNKTERQMMSTTDKKQPVAVVRNGITKVLVESQFSKRADAKIAGQTLFYPEINITVPDDVTWAGVETINDAANAKLRALFGSIIAKNLEENNGVLNMPDFLAAAADFTAARESLAGIDEELESLYSLQEKLSSSPDFGAENPDGTPTEEAKQLTIQIKANNQKIRPLKEKKAAIEAEYERRAAVRAANKAKQEAEAKTIQAQPATA